MNEALKRYRGRLARARRWIALGALIGLAIVVPYLMFGQEVEAMVQAALRAAASRPWLIAALVVLLLACDVVLPIPSSLVGAFAGAMLGIAAGALVVWVGLTLGCVCGYWIGRGIAGVAPGTPTEADQAVLPEGRPDRTGHVLLAATRSVPVMAEAGVLAAGISRMGFGPFILVTAIANLAVAFAYASIGAWLVSLDPALAAMVATLVPAAAWGLWYLGRSGMDLRAARLRSYP